VASACFQPCELRKIWNSLHRPRVEIFLEKLNIWLLNTSTFETTEFIGEEVPPYAILSHTWGVQEITFQDLKTHEFENKNAFPKLRDFCKTAALHGHKWGWIDTCCIDKSSSAELSEAINSMYRWYANADICFAYLVDVPTSSFPDKFGESRWFTRGWTLQELIAPEILEFYSTEWTKIGCKTSLKEEISKISGIPVDVLQGEDLMKHSLGERMSWASPRRTTRPEDRAYSLMGLFDVNMPLLYGEGGPKAFVRLQQEILASCEEDHSLFIWRPHTIGHRGLLTTSPEDFCTSKTCIRCGIGGKRDFDYPNLGDTFLSTKLLRDPPSLTGHGVRISLQLYLRENQDSDSEMKSSTDEEPANHPTSVMKATSFRDDEEAMSFTGDEQAISVTGDEEAISLTGTEEAISLTGDEKLIRITDKSRVMASLNLFINHTEDPSRGESLCVSLKPHSHKPEQYTRRDFETYLQDYNWRSIGVHTIFVHQKPPRPMFHGNG
jgi:hypothetical protein